MPPRNARSVGSKRYYDWAGERFWSVTTILNGGIPKPALLPWGIKSVAEGAVEAHQNGALGPMIDQDPDAAVQFLKGLPYSKRDRAANLGTEIHEAIETLTQGRPMPDWPLPVRPHMEQFADFVATCQPEWIASEASVYSRTQAYAGTLDFIARIDGRTVIGDAKTGKAIYPEVALQLAAYRRAEFIGLPDGNEQPMPEVEGAVALHLTADGWRLLEVDTGDQVYESFLYAREVFRWASETAKRVIGDEVAAGAATQPDPADRAAEAFAKYGGQ